MGVRPRTRAPHARAHARISARLHPRSCVHSHIRVRVRVPVQVPVPVRACMRACEHMYMCVLANGQADGGAYLTSTTAAVRIMPRESVLRDLTTVGKRSLRQMFLNCFLHKFLDNLYHQDIYGILHQWGHLPLLLLVIGLSYHYKGCRSQHFHLGLLLY